MFELKSFNNWIKAVLINKYCELRQSDLQRIYDLPSTYSSNLLHVLDIGCGHGQDINKWALNKVNYLVGVDIAADSLAEYKKRWATKSPYAFKGVALSGSHPDLYDAV
jgi:SAM-dependent methyltransferase